MNDYRVVHPGPHFQDAELIPYTTTAQTTTTLVSMVPGLRGPVIRRKHQVCVFINGKRLLRADFSRGMPLVLLEKDNRFYIVTQKAYEARTPKTIQLIGSDC